jgi:hypothetical protein
MAAIKIFFKKLLLVTEIQVAFRCVGNTKCAAAHQLAWQHESFI